VTVSVSVPATASNLGGGFDCVVCDAAGTVVLRVEGYGTVPLPDPLPADVHAPIRSAMRG